MASSRRCVVLLVLSLWAACPVAVAATMPDGGAVMYVVEPTGRVPRPMNGTLRITARDDYATVIVVGLLRRGRRGEVKRVMRVESAGVTYCPEVYGTGGPDPRPDCSVSHPSELRAADAPIRISADPEPTTLTFLIAYARADVVIDPSSGWRQRRVNGGRLVIVGNSDTNGAGAKAGRLSIEHFVGTSVVASGPSVAFAAIPCPPDPYLLARPGGSGQGVLLGGDPDRGPQTMRCADRTWFSFGVARAKTNWELRGDVLGYTSQLVRLAVVVLPPLSSRG